MDAIEALASKQPDAPAETASNDSQEGVAEWCIAYLHNFTTRNNDPARRRELARWALEFLTQYKSEMEAQAKCPTQECTPMKLLP